MNEAEQLLDNKLVLRDERRNGIILCHQDHHAQRAAINLCHQDVVTGGRSQGTLQKVLVLDSPQILFIACDWQLTAPYGMLFTYVVYFKVILADSVFYI